MTVPALGGARSPVDVAPLGGVDLLCVAVAKQNSFDLAIQERARFGVSGIEAVVIDQQRLVDEPLLPAVVTNVTQEPLPEVILEWSLG